MQGQRAAPHCGMKVRVADYIHQLRKAAAQEVALTDFTQQRQMGEVIFQPQPPKMIQKDKKYLQSENCYVKYYLYVHGKAEN